MPARFARLLLTVINRGAAVLIVDMTATQSCDHAGVDALARAYQRQRAVVGGTLMRLVLSAPVVRRVVAIEGLDRLISVHPTLEAAIAAGGPDIPVRLSRSTAIGGRSKGGRRLRRRSCGALSMLWAMEWR